MHNATMTHASSVSTNLSSIYDELPGHHLTSIRNLVASSPDDSYPESSAESVRGQENPEWDYSGLHDREALVSFHAAADYCLTCSDDSSGGDYDPSEECFMVVIGNEGAEEDEDDADPANDAPAAVLP
jgi:hypothetical protein